MATVRRSAEMNRFIGLSMKGCKEGKEMIAEEEKEFRTILLRQFFDTVLLAIRAKYMYMFGDTEEGRRLYENEYLEFVHSIHRRLYTNFFRKEWMFQADYKPYYPNRYLKNGETFGPWREDMEAVEEMKWNMPFPGWCDELDGYIYENACSFIWPY